MPRAAALPIRPVAAEAVAGQFLGKAAMGPYLLGNLEDREVAVAAAAEQLVGQEVAGEAVLAVPVEKTTAAQGETH